MSLSYKSQQTPECARAITCQPEPKKEGQQGENVCPADCSRYKFTRFLGAGGFGSVWKVVDVTDGCRPFALKKVQLREAWSSGPREYRGVDPGMIMELQILKHHADHPNLVKVHDIFFACDGRVPEQPDSVYIVMELADSGDLFDWIHMESERRYNLDTIRQFAVYMRHTLLGLQHLHGQTIAHLDIKPENVLLTANFRQAQLSDYGLSNWERAAYGDVGTVGYRAPEITALGLDPSGKYAVDGMRADIYSIGRMILAFMASYGTVWSVTDTNGRRDGRYVYLVDFLVPSPGERGRDHVSFNQKKLQDRVGARFVSDADVNKDSKDNKFVARGMWESMWQLALSCLAKDPLDRPTASEALQHDLFARVDASAVCLSADENKKRAQEWRGAQAILPPPYDPRKSCSSRDTKSLYAAVLCRARDEYRLALSPEALEQMHETFWAEPRNVAVIALALWIAYRARAVGAAEATKPGGSPTPFAIACINLAAKQLLHSALFGAPEEAGKQRQMEIRVMVAADFQMFVDTSWYEKPEDLIYLQQMWCTAEDPRMRR